MDFFWGEWGVTENVVESWTLQVRTQETFYVENEWTVFLACININ
jgi:hypothetical protein